ncbi:MAG: TIM44-like domain-containing protein [Candidatus Riflebacteria bacterium]|nr:TIM44-like domain-containing protein [Candidatus Riflebacteria bacterium]
MRKLFWIIIILCLFLTSVILHARAGGGQSYSGHSSSYSGHSSSSSGSGGSGGADVVYLLIRLCIEYPKVGIPLIICILIFFYYGGNETREIYIDSTIRRGIKAQKGLQMSRALNVMKSRDPGWDREPFLQRMNKAFLIIQEGWSGQDLSKLQNFVSDGIFERFYLQINEQKEAQIRDHMEAIEIREVDIAQIQSDKHFDTINVYFRAKAVNYRVDLKTNKFKEGSTEPEEFEEYWSFIRKPGAQTLKKPGLIEGCCPNCSAPVNLVRTAKCESCGSFLRSGEYDWVLSEITQASEWDIVEFATIAGFREIQELDQGFNVQHIEDLSSVIFYRYMAAIQHEKIETLQKFALEDFCEELKKRLKSSNLAERPIKYRSCAIGSVGVAAIDTSGDLDRVYSEVKWCGYPDKKNNNSLLGMGSPYFFKDFYILARKHGICTDTKISLSSTSCANCGAPESSAVEFACKYCGTVLNDGSKEWVLEEITSSGNLKIQNKIREINASSRGAGIPANAEEIVTSNAEEGFLLIPEGFSKSQIISWMIYMMKIDGIIDPKELETLRNFAKRIKFPQNVLETMINQPLSHESFEASIAEFTESKQVAEILRFLATMALADGRLASEELTVLDAVRKKGNLLPVDVKMIISRERSRLYDEAKKAISQAKKTNI